MAAPLQSLRTYLLARLVDAPPAIRAKAALFVGVNLVIAVLLAINAVVVEVILTHDTIAGDLEFGWIAVIVLSFALLRRGRYAAASNLTIAVGLASLGSLGFEPSFGSPLFAFAKLGLLLAPAIVYAFLVGEGKSPPVLATLFSLLLVGVFFVTRLARDVPGGPGAPEISWLVSEVLLISVIGYMSYGASAIYLDAIAVAEERLLVTVRDVERRKVEQQERAALENRLRQAEKMDAIGQLAGGVAHDFNNQLTAILGYGELLRLAAKDEESASFAEHIVRASRRSADLTRQLLTFARKGHYQVVPVDVHALITEVVTLLERSIDKRITLRTAFMHAPAVVLGDPTQLEAALLNLAINARDAMPEGGELVVATRALEPEARARKSTPPAPGPWVRISVTDTGTGMTEATLKRLFEPFFTTKPPGKGTGMGLASVYGAVQIHKGTISVDSQVGRGTTFEIDLPLAEAAASGERGEPRALENLAQLRVLVVDDEQDVRDLIREMLARAGCEVRACQDGAEALALFAEEWRRIDVVILDLMMPRMSGRDVFAALRRIDPAARILIASGYSLDGEAQALLDGGAIGFLQKPFELSTLLAQLRARPSPPAKDADAGGEAADAPSGEHRERARDA